VEPVTVLTALGLLGGGVAALWKLAIGMGRFQGTVTAGFQSIEKTLKVIQHTLDDHEERLRTVERPSR
jgi:hypothetical protein